MIDSTQEQNSLNIPEVDLNLKESISLLEQVYSKEFEEIIVLYNDSEILALDSSNLVSDPCKLVSASSNSVLDPSRLVFWSFEVIRNKTV